MKKQHPKKITNAPITKLLPTEMSEGPKVFCEDPSRWGKTLAFFRTIQECMDFREKLALKGINCDVVTGKSNKDAQIEAFRTGAVQVVANVAVLGEGFDVPDLESVFIRDASSLPTIQMAGRGLRRAQGKAFCKLVQSGKTGYAVERIAAPAESFRYMRGAWLSCAGNTQAITETIQRIEVLLAQHDTSFVRKPILHPIRWISVSKKYLQ